MAVSSRFNCFICKFAVELIEYRLLTHTHRRTRIRTLKQSTRDEETETEWVRCRGYCVFNNCVRDEQSMQLCINGIALFRINFDHMQDSIFVDKISKIMAIIPHTHWWNIGIFDRNRPPLNKICTINDAHHRVSCRSMWLFTIIAVGIL